MREPLTGLPASLSARSTFVDAVVGHLLVDLAGELDELGRHVELARPPASGRRGRPAGSGRPCPGPGSKRMKPYGLVAAASTTSQMSMPMRSVSIASSLTSAMLTERKMFSSSLVSSAASGVETRTIVVADLARRAPRRARCTPSVRPPTTFGVLRSV